MFECGCVDPLAVCRSDMYLCSVCVCVEGVCKGWIWVYGVTRRVGTCVPPSVCAHAWSCAGKGLPGCMRDGHLGPHKVCVNVAVIPAGPRWVCPRAPRNSLAILGKHCLLAPRWSLPPHWTPVTCTCKLVRWRGWGESRSGEE